MRSGIQVSSRHACNPMVTLDFSIIRPARHGRPSSHRNRVNSASSRFSPPSAARRRESLPRPSRLACELVHFRYSTGSQGLDVARVSRWSNTEGKASVIHPKPPRIDSQPLAMPGGRRRQATGQCRPVPQYASSRSDRPRSCPCQPGLLRQSGRRIKVGPSGRIAPP